MFASESADQGWRWRNQVTRLARRFEERRAGGPRGHRRRRSSAEAIPLVESDTDRSAQFAERVLQAEPVTEKPRRRRLRSPAVRYGAAAIVILVGTVLIAISAPHLQMAPFMPAILAIALVTWLAGTVAAVVATIVLGLATALFVIPPGGRFALIAMGQTAAVLFLVTATVVVVLVAWLRARLRRAELRTQDLERISHSLRKRARESGELAEQLRAVSRRAEAARDEANTRLDRAREIQELSVVLCRDGHSTAEIAASAIDRAPAILACDVGAVLEPVSGGDRMRIVASRGLSGPVVQSIESLEIADPSPQTLAYREGTSVWVRNGHEAARFGDSAAAWQAARVGALAALPLRAGTRTVGVLVLGYRAAQAFEDADRQLVEQFARQVEHAWDHARMSSAPIVAKAGRRGAGRRRGDAPTAGTEATTAGST